MRNGGQTCTYSDANSQVIETWNYEENQGS